ncbi:cell wall hydrolase [Thermaurantiacus sp.]
MIDVKRLGVAAGSAVLLTAAGSAPFDGDVAAWISADSPTPPAAETMMVEAAPIAEDPEIAAAADVPAPEVLTWDERAASLRALVAEVRFHAEAAAMDKDMECLARAVYWEARGEPLEGQLAVAEVILNRVERGRFGRDVCDVVTAPRQFSFVRGGAIPAPVNRAQYAEAKAIAWIALADAWKPIVGAATHFHARHVNPGWRLTRVAEVGNHIFYR